MTAIRKNVLVGFVVLVGMLGLGWMILKLANTSAVLFTHGTTHFRLQADRADGVAEGSPVLYLGVNVGRVMGVRRMPNNDGVLIEAILNAGEQIPINVVGLIKAQGALSAAAQVSLEPVGPPVAQYIQQSSQVQAHFGGSGLVPPELISLATQVREQQLIRHVDDAVVTMRLELEKAGKLLDSAHGVIGDEGLRGDVRGTVASIRRTSDNLEKFSGQLEKVSDETTQTVKQVRVTVADGGQRLDQLSGQLTERLQQLAAVLDRIQSIASKVDKGEGTAGRLVNDPRLYESLVDSSRDLDITFKSMQRLVDQWEQDGFALKLK